MTDRREFLKLSVRSFVDALKEAALPLLEDQGEKVEAIAQLLEGKVWAEVPFLRDEEKLAQRFVGQHLLFLAKVNRHMVGQVQDQGQRQDQSQQGGLQGGPCTDEVEAIDGSCPTCGSALMMRMFDLSLLCLRCNLVEQPTRVARADQVFSRIPLKQEKDIWLVEVRRNHA